MPFQLKLIWQSQAALAALQRLAKQFMDVFGVLHVGKGCAAFLYKNAILKRRSM